MPRTDNQSSDDTKVSAPDSRLFARRPFRTIPAHALIFTVSLFISFALAYNMHVGVEWFPRVFVPWLIMTLIVRLTVFGLFHQYQGSWRYVSVLDLFAVMRGAFFSTLILVGLWYIGMNFEPLRQVMYAVNLAYVPQSVHLLDCAATIAFVCGAKLATRLYFEETQAPTEGRVQRLLIVGAGNAGEALLREINRMSIARYEPVGFVDDDPRKLGMRIHGIPVLGTVDEIKDIVAKYNVDELAIAMPSATRRQLRRVIEQCQGTNLRFSTIPDLVDIASGKLAVSQMRNVDINDLLGREPVSLDMDQIANFLCDKVILITGAGGSIGSEMCRQVGHFRPKMLVLVEQAENPLFFIERELRRMFPEMHIQARICDIADATRVEAVFDEFHPEVVIHAAAHKHVPLMEINPGEAIKNNVLGTRTVAMAAHKHGVSHFVFISTDKAVNPTSVMGSSKRLAEMSIQCLNRESKTDFIMVRFGNVLGSNGSVIPLFRQQIAAGGPVTVTHPEMQRYFMTIPEASQLVLQAATMGRGGEVFVLDMGEPVKIVNLARDLITLSGFRVGEDIEIQYTGMRPGEKLFEELATTGENMVPTRHPKIAIWSNEPPSREMLDAAVEKLAAAAQDGRHKEIVRLIKEIVPEYVGDVDHKDLHAQHMRNNGKGQPADA